MAWTFHTDLFPCWKILGGPACLTATTRSMPTESLSLVNCGNKTKLLVLHSHAPRPPRRLKARRDASLRQIRIYPPHTAPANTHLRLSWAQTANARCAGESTCSELLELRQKLLPQNKVSVGAGFIISGLISLSFFYSRNKKNTKQRRAWLKQGSTLSLDRRHHFPKVGTLRGLRKQAILSETHEQPERWPPQMQEAAAASGISVPPLLHVRPCRKTAQAFNPPKRHRANPTTQHEQGLLFLWSTWLQRKPFWHPPGNTCMTQSYTPTPFFF